MKMGMVVALIFGAGVALTGDLQAKVMTDQQPMKMAAAEAIWDTQAPASFSVFTIGTPDGETSFFPCVSRTCSPTSPRATSPPRSRGSVMSSGTRRSGSGRASIGPIIPVTYWSFRYMIGFGMLTSALSLLGLWLLRGGRLPASPWFYRVALWTIPFPLIANSFGWLFTEMGRQPWVVYGQMFTRDGVSPAGRAGDGGHVADRADAALPGAGGRRGRP